MSEAELRKCIRKLSLPEADRAVRAGDWGAAAAAVADKAWYYGTRGVYWPAWLAIQQYRGLTLEDALQVLPPRGPAWLAQWARENNFPDLYRTAFEFLLQLQHPEKIEPASDRNSHYLASLFSLGEYGKILTTIELYFNERERDGTPARLSESVWWVLAAAQLGQCAPAVAAAKVMSKKFPLQGSAWACLAAAYLSVGEAKLAGQAWARAKKCDYIEEEIREAILPTLPDEIRNATLATPNLRDQIAFLEDKLGVTLPEALKREMARPKDPREIFQPIDPELIPDLTQRYDSFCTMHGSVMFWKAVDSAEYAAIYLKGPLSGRIYLWSYDGRHTSIAFRSTDTFKAAMLGLIEEDEEDSQSWQEAPTDYYIDTSYYYHGKAVENPRDAQAIQSDLEAREQLERPDSGDPEEAQQFYAFNFMALTPPSQAHEIIPFLEDEDMWIQARAAQILGRAKWASAVPNLLEVARSGGHNGRTAAFSALERIASDECIRGLASLLGELDKGYAGHISSSLARAGYEIREQGDKIEYRKLGSGPWLLANLD